MSRQQHKGPNRPSQPTRTLTTEYGYFIRKKLRHGKKRGQKTTEIKKNPHKTILCKIGDIEIYCLPHDFPDRVFLGLYPLSTQLEEHEIREIIRAYNIVKWYFKGHWQRKKTHRKGANYRRRYLRKAYNTGLKQTIDRRNELVRE